MTSSSSFARHNRATAAAHETTYTFASQPRALQPQRRKYRNDLTAAAAAADGDEDRIFYGNIMFDKRVIRGNTYAQHALPSSAIVDPVEVQKQKEKSRREIVKKRANRLLRVKSPEPVEGRRHIEMQTEIYLEELSDRVEETEAECQTDAFLDRPPSPLFVPAKSGIDKETQILDGDLFDFDVEVLPVLEVLVGKTLEQALLEVMEEEELANLREQQRTYEEMHNAEIMEQQRLEEQERRHKDEKDRRMKQREEMLEDEKETAARIAAHAFARSYLADLIPSVFGILTENGYFYDPVEREIEKSFLPWVMDCVDDHLTKIIRSRRLLDGLLRQIVSGRQRQFLELELKADDRSSFGPFESVANTDLPQLVIEEEDALSTEAEAGRNDDIQSEGQEFANEANAESDRASEEEERED